jgi:hypothetical protein
LPDEFLEIGVVGENGILDEAVKRQADARQVSLKQCGGLALHGAVIPHGMRR